MTLLFGSNTWTSIQTDLAKASLRTHATTTRRVSSRVPCPVGSGKVLDFTAPSPTTFTTPRATTAPSRRITASVGAFTWPGQMGNQ